MLKRIPVQLSNFHVPFGQLAASSAMKISEPFLC